MLWFFWNRYPSQQITLPQNAVEIEVSDKILKTMRVDGYCIPIESFEWFLEAAEQISMNDAQDIYAQMICWPKEVEFICITASVPVGILSNDLIESWKIAVKNHERCHCLTMKRSGLWFRLLDSTMLQDFGTQWLKITDNIAHIRGHKQIKKYYGYTWVAICETLSRIAAVLATPSKYRARVAKYQLGKNSKKIMKLAHQIKNKYGSVENLINTIQRMI